MMLELIHGMQFSLAEILYLSKNGLQVKLMLS